MPKSTDIGRCDVVTLPGLLAAEEILGLRVDTSTGNETRPFVPRSCWEMWMKANLVPSQRRVHCAQREKE